MKKSPWFLTAFIWMTAAHSSGMAAELNLPREIQALKERIEELEQKLEEQESLAKRQAAKSEAKLEEETGEPIGLRRLEARPTARLSLEAQQRHEQEERQKRIRV